MSCHFSKKVGCVDVDFPFAKIHRTAVETADFRLQLFNVGKALFRTHHIGTGGNLFKQRIVNAVLNEQPRSGCGKMERLLDLSSQWAATRVQFGQAIGKFQGTSFKLADRATERRAADLLVRAACQKADEGTMTANDAAMAKLFGSEALGRAADNSVQIFGGMGLMEDLPIERLWREARIERIWDGMSEIQRHIIARSQLRPYET